MLDIIKFYISHFKGNFTFHHLNYLLCTIQFLTVCQLIAIVYAHWRVQGVPHGGVLCKGLRSALNGAYHVPDLAEAAEGSLGGSAEVATEYVLWGEYEVEAEEVGERRLEAADQPVAWREIPR